MDNALLLIDVFAMLLYASPVCAGCFHCSAYLVHKLADMHSHFTERVLTLSMNFVQGCLLYHLQEGVAARRYCQF